MVTTSMIVELRRRDGVGIFAVPYVGGRRRAPERLPDGAIVEAPGPLRRGDAPRRPEAVLAFTSDGRPASVHHANLGLIASYAALTGVYLLSSGVVAAVYGAAVEPLDSPT